MNALSYLQRIEWSLRHDQCPECCGVNSVWFGTQYHKNASSIGHKPVCDLAAAIKELRGEPLMMGGYVPTPGEKQT